MDNIGIYIISFCRRKKIITTECTSGCPWYIRGTTIDDFASMATKPSCHYRYYNYSKISNTTNGHLCCIYTNVQSRMWMCDFKHFRVGDFYWMTAIALTRYLLKWFSQSAFNDSYNNNINNNITCLYKACMCNEIVFMYAKFIKIHDRQIEMWLVPTYIHTAHSTQHNNIIIQ